jgi:hypothetical protein
MEAISVLADVRCFETAAGNARYVARTADGHEYTTFREAIGQQAKAMKGSRVRITYHEVQRGRYTNVYLDELEALEPPKHSPAPGTTVTDVQEAAWRTAVEATPWLVGEPDEAVDPDELYEKLKPFEQRVADDIASQQSENET